jgi:hypothetical protein
MPDVPYVIAAWRREHPDTEPADGQIFTQPWPAGPTDNRRDQVLYYQYKADRARRTLRGIDEQVAKAEKAVAGKVPVKRNRFVRLTGATKSVNRELEAKARGLAGFKGYVTNIDNPTPQFVLDAYHRLYHIEKSFRMSKHSPSSQSPWAAVNASMTGSMVAVSALLPSNASTISGNPAASVSNPMVTCGSSRRSLENPGSRNPSPASALEVQRAHVVEHQRRRPQARVRRTSRRQPLPPRPLGVDR